MVQARNTNLRFRDGDVSDAARIADIGRHTFSETFGHVYKKSDLDAYLKSYFSEERVGRDLADDNYDYRIAEAPSGLLGYAKIGPVSPGLKQEFPDALQLHRLYVREARQGVGVGGILLSWAIERARERGAATLCLGVWTNNQHAIRVYENRGFKNGDTYEIYVGDAKDQELKMSLDLKQSSMAQSKAS